MANAFLAKFLNTNGRTRPCTCAFVSTAQVQQRAAVAGRAALAGGITPATRESPAAWIC